MIAYCLVQDNGDGSFRSVLYTNKELVDYLLEEDQLYCVNEGSPQFEIELPDSYAEKKERFINRSTLAQYKEDYGIE